MKWLFGGVDRLNSKAKGSAGERELAEILRQAGHTEAHRNEQRYIGGKENPDVSLEGFHVEVKRAEKFNAYSALEQAEADANGKAIPIVCHRRNRKPWIVIMKLTDWLKMMKPRP